MTRYQLMMKRFRMIVAIALAIPVLFFFFVLFLLEGQWRGTAIYSISEAMVERALMYERTGGFNISESPENRNKVRALRRSIWRAWKERSIFDEYCDLPIDMRGFHPKRVPLSFTIIMGHWPPRSITFFFGDVPDMSRFDHDMLLGELPSSDLVSIMLNQEIYYEEVFGYLPVSKLRWEGENCGNFSYLLLRR